jgi:hypothetical protein
MIDLFTPEIAENTFFNIVLSYDMPSDIAEHA